MNELLNWITPTITKAIIIALLIFIARKWSNGGLNKPIQKLKKIRTRYGITTILLIIIWWLITPSLSADDIITVIIITKIGIIPYILIVGLLTAYIIYRLKITITIYKNKK